jgi:dipeptidyl aminopeptidase/acylaminoacyl peptidase
MSRRRRTLILSTTVVVLLVAGGLAYRTWAPVDLPAHYTQSDLAPQIFPDYQDCVIPPNIAPLNFLVKEEGTAYRARIYADKGQEIIVGSRNGKIQIPIESWHELLADNRGGQVYTEVYVRGPEGQWTRFETFSNQVANEPVDPYVAYRWLNGPNHHLMPAMGTYQRHVESFDQTPIWVSSEGSCANCHTFINNDPSSMIMHIRGTDGTAMVLAQEDGVQKIDTKTSFNPPVAFTSWHPSGKVAAFSDNTLRLVNQTLGESRTSIDYSSGLTLYDLVTNTISRIPAIVALEQRQTFPTWSPDGKYLYFASGVQPWEDGLADKVLPQEFTDIQYDLMRIAYDIDSGQWGEVEIVLSHEELGLSMVEPRISPDGRYLMVTAAEYGGFPLYIDSDLYMLDLETGDHWPLEQANSDQCDSWHSWSTNGRWVVFGSKRRDHLLTKLYFTYIDEQGQASKAFLLPQEDPTYYDALLKTYNVPELLTGPVLYTREELSQVITPEVRAVPVQADPASTTGETRDSGRMQTTDYDIP